MKQSEMIGFNYVLFYEFDILWKFFYLKDKAKYP